jgi:hypothetical protein
MTGILKVDALQNNTGTQVLTLNSAGTITPGNGLVDWTADLKIGDINSSYQQVREDQNFLTKYNATQCNAVYYLINSHMVHISWYYYKNSHTQITTNYGWAIQLPSILKCKGSSGAGYQFIPSGYMGWNGTHWANDGSTATGRWQSNGANGGTVLQLYGPKSTTSWSSGTLEMHGSGVLYLETAVE